MRQQSIQPYVGRFAPSPTGPVHFGTLIAAVGSYLQARKNGGQWLVRMEDVDVTRKVGGADTLILNTLEIFGFQWHGKIIYQSTQTEHYQQAFEALNKQSLLFPCLCTRKQLSESDNDIYPGTCRNRKLPEKELLEQNPQAIRLLANNITIEFEDIVMGNQAQNIQQQCGDFIIKRRDALFAYQLAVVVDDAMQNVTEIVRGADLLDSTPQQIYLQQLLGLNTPNYCHLPLVVDANGNKVSKSEGGFAVDVSNKERLLLEALVFLGQSPPDALFGSSINDIWTCAIAHWDVSLVPT